MSPGQVIVAGHTLIRWAGRLWRVERINRVGHGPLLAIYALEDDSFELICAVGCDGPFEVVGE